MTINYVGNDFYCDIAIPKKVDLKIVFENENILAFYHTKPFYEIHIVVVPKKHIDSFLTLNMETEFAIEFIKKVQDIARDVESQHGKARILTNLGHYQDSKHLHFHVASGSVIARV
jgi:histidine triad (HIT) family protein